MATLLTSSGPVEVAGATAQTWVREDVFLAVLAERDRLDAELAAAEAELATLRQRLHNVITSNR